MYERQQLFDFMLERINEVGVLTGLEPPQAFGRWFVDMYFEDPQDVFVSDGTKDGKVDLFFTTHDEETVQHHVLNAKFTKKYNNHSAVAFYDEITRFWQAFANKPRRNAYLREVVRPELRQRYRMLFERYDAGKAQLTFVTNHRRNDEQYATVRESGVQIFHLEDVVQFMADYIEGAMPRTKTMLLTGISKVLSADKRETEVSTSIVFARLVDLIKYMEKDPWGLLFARNVRLSLGSTPVNKAIRDTFSSSPKEFVFSNNGITMLCERHRHDPGPEELTIENPRIVNGSQTLHSIRDVANPSRDARVMVRIIEIPPPLPSELSSQTAKRKDVIHKISIRSNLQNPIKKWNLVSNDDFQNELARYFRKKKLFYERRDKEWSHRRTELKSVGIRRGPHIKRLAQLMSSYYWDKKQLGPATAKVGVSELFEDKKYGVIRDTPPELAYQIYLLDEIIWSAFSILSAQKRYVANLSGHIDLALFSVIVKVLESSGGDWGKEAFTSFLEEQLKNESRRWVRLTKGAVDHIRRFYKRQAKAYRRTEGKELTFNNYFKAPGYVAKILNAPIHRPMGQVGRRILTTM